MKKFTQLGAALLSSVLAFDIAFAGQKVTEIIETKSSIANTSSTGFSCVAYVSDKQEKLNILKKKQKALITPIAVTAVYKLMIKDKQSRYKNSLSYLQALSSGKRDKRITKLAAKAIAKRPTSSLLPTGQDQVKNMIDIVDASKTACKKIYKSRASSKRKDRMLVRAMSRGKI